MTKRRFFSGDSLTQAVNQAAQHFQVPAGEINYKQIEKRHGFLKVRRKVLIEVDEENPLRDTRATEAEASSPSPSPESTASDTWSEVVRVPAAAEQPTAEEAPAVSRSTADRAEERTEHEPRSDGEERAEEPRQADEPKKATSWFDLSPDVEEPEEDWEEDSAPSAELSGAVKARETDPESAGSTRTDREAEGEAIESRADAAAGSDQGAKTGRPRRSRRGRGRGGRREQRDGSKRVELAEAPLAAKARYSEAQGEEAEAAAEALDRILKLAGLVVESEILQADEHLQIELRGADQDLLLRDRGRLLLAIQHLLPRVIRGLIGRSVVCKVDSDNYHEIREERLRDMAQRAADEVRDSGRPKTLEPMSPDERRIVHLTLADYPGVETESHGSGLFKRVMVRGIGDRHAERSGRSERYRR